MDLVTLVFACGLAARSPLFVPFGAPPDCLASADERAADRAAAGNDPTDRWTTEIILAAARFAVPAPWLRGILRAESGGDAHATSPAGAMGLMQIMPATWERLRRRYALGSDPYDPQDNLLAGAAYVRELIDRYGAPGFLAAYHAGPARLDAHLLTGTPLPEETRRYIATLAPHLTGTHAARDTAADSMRIVGTRPARNATADVRSDGLFADRSAASRDAGRMLDRVTGHGLFVPLDAERSDR